jgi:hypothetical protein
MKRAVVCALLIAACDPPSVPVRTAAYPFDNGAGDVFRWPSTHLPVRFFADTRGPIPRIVARSFRVWEAQFLYGEFRGQEISDSSNADVIVVFTGTVPADVPPDSGPPVVACGGFTRFVLDTTTNVIDSAIVITIQRLAVTATDRQVVACLRRVIAHEVGHTVGLLQHSPDALDLMASQPVVDRASERDRMTAEVLYHTPPSIGPPPR